MHANSNPLKAAVAILVSGFKEKSNNGIKLTMKCFLPDYHFPKHDLRYSIANKINYLSLTFF